MSDRTRVARRAFLLAAFLVAIAGHTSAVAAPYAAQFVAQSLFPTLEQGDTTELFFEFRNTGDQPWYRDGAIPVRLGTSNPKERASPFYNPPDWISSGRPTGLDQASVAPGAIGTFTFLALAPAQTGVFREHYTPLAEGQAWMLPEDFVWLDQTVIPAQPPTVKITASPARVKRGDKITVSADVTDNRKVARVEFEVGNQAVALGAPTKGQSGYQAELNSAALGAGTQTLIVRGTDPGGRQAVATKTFEVLSTAGADADADGVSPPLDCDDNNPAIHPGVVDKPRDRIDQDCSGGDAIFPELTATTTFVYAYKKLTLVRRIDITRLKGGETVTIRCTGRRCPFKVKTYRKVKNGNRSFGRSLLRGRRLPAGTALSVRVTKRQTIGTYTALKVRRRKAPAITRKCLQPGRNRPSKCL